MIKTHIFTVSVREGRCNSVPAKCMGPNADVAKICENDKDCDGNKKCCVSLSGDVCVKQCLPPVAGNFSHFYP